MGYIISTVDDCWDLIGNLTDVPFTVAGCWLLGP
jgi:hypothetical protein